MQDNLSETLAHFTGMVDAEVRAVLHEHAAPHDFYGMMRYHLGFADERLEPVSGAHGKGLRGLLLLLVDEGLGGDAAAAVPRAAAVELLHNFSLVHDDIEDSSTTRRHRPTMWSLWGVPISINAGDGMYAMAHLALLRSPLRREAPGRLIEIMAQFEQTALRLCEGQHLDMTFERRADVAVEEYLAMIGGKTAALIGAAAALGALAAGATPQQAAEAETFGRELGLAFQMQDDILGIWGDERVTGKSATSDLASRKKTLPVLLAMERADPDVQARLRELYARAADGAAGIGEIMALLDSTGARDAAAGYQDRYWSAAMAALDRIGLPHDDRERLRRFAESFVKRAA
jgi:geranylgeranyl diphosphate synthase type I